MIKHPGPFSPALRNLLLIPLCLALFGCPHDTDGDRTSTGNAPRFYAGLPKQSVGIMVWADRGILIDHPSLQLDIANTLQDTLIKTKADEMKEVTWPVQAASIVRYQRDHPGIEASPITDLAPKIGVTRLLYIEIDNVSTRTDASLQMFRGNMLASLKIIEITNGQAKVAFEERDIHAVFPPKSPPEGELNRSDTMMYNGVVVMMARKL